MSMLEIVRQVRQHLEESARLSYRMLRREFTLDDESLEELVDIQRVAVRKGQGARMVRRRDADLSLYAEAA